MTTYSTGTLSVGAGSTSVTGAGTGWLAGGVRAGDILLAAGSAVPIAAVGSATSITLARPWPGSALSGANYDILLIDDNVRTLVAANTLMQSLGNGTLTSLAGLASAANKLAYFSGANAMALADLTSQARGLLGGTALSRAGTAYTLAGNLTVNGVLAGTAVTQGAFDRTPGRLAKVGDPGIGGAVQLTGSTPLHERDLPPGNYSYSAAGVPGGPENGAWSHTLQVMEWAIGSSFRRLWIASRPSSNLASCRTWLGFNVDQEPIAWLPLPVGSQMVGTVSQVDGVPTGAVIETGSNANGQYTRWADGTQICHRTISGLGPIQTADGALFRSAEIASGTWPAAFVSAPSATLAIAKSAGITATCGGNFRYGAGSTVRPPFFLWAATSNAATDFTATVTAIGRWY